MREFGAESRWFGEGWRGGCGVWRERMLGRGTHLGRTWVRVGKKKDDNGEPRKIIQVERC
jgi:hypothetical protein